MAFFVDRSSDLSPETVRSHLGRLAANYRWTWCSSTRALFDRLPRTGDGLHPVETVAALSRADLEDLARDHQLAGSLDEEIRGLEACLESPQDPRIAYCSPEFGLSSLLPQYAGGLGVLAGDHLKSASDLGVPLAGVGLFYREGVFRQVIEGGEQTERYDQTDPERAGANDTGVMVSIPFPGREVHARVWRIDVGRVPLLVLDTDVDENTAEDRKITDRLYSGSPLHRLEQEMVLGVGGARALASIGWDIELHHLNEGHAGFIVLELLDRVIGDVGFERAIETVKNGLVFTTHTPVPAGIDRFEEDTIGPYLQPWAESWNIPLGPLMELGEDPVHRGTFNMAALCLRSSRTANGVSELHGAVSRKLFAGVGRGDDIGHVTNGVHARTWTATHTQDIFDAALGRGWAVGEAEAWQKVTAIDDDLLSAIRQRSSRILADLVRARTGEVLDPEALIVGFARRFAPYKRASLLLRQPEMLEELLADDNRAVHFVFAGKAHPSDAAGKGLVAELVQATSGELVNGRVTFIPDYEMEIAHAMVQGADVWLNNPIRPREASGTSGEKAVLNGSLNCSVLDGWWAEMYDGENGWEIAVSDSPDPDQRDREESSGMLRTIGDIANEYHAAHPMFLGRIRHAWATLGPRVTAARMLRDYQDRVYRLG